MDLITQSFVCVDGLICYSGRTTKQTKFGFRYWTIVFRTKIARLTKQKSVCLWPGHYNGTAKRERERTFYIKVKTKPKKTFHSRPSPAKGKLSSRVALLLLCRCIDPLIIHPAATGSPTTLSL